MHTLGSHFRRRLITYASITAFLVLVAGGGFAAFESHQVSNYWEGLWWALSLMSTVGFVGASPDSVEGRVLSSVLMVSGFSLMALVTAAISSLFVREDAQPQEEAEDLFEAKLLELMDDLSRRLAAIEAAVAVAPTRGADSGPESSGTTS